MGVHGLWELLAPVGRRVSVETLAGKRVAIDASIWLVQFMKAMRDEKGEMVRNAHLLGFFRRICKLLFLRTKPVFVFDGGTPALKRRTVIARRRQRENAQTKIRKTAEKLLLNQLKSARLKELAKDLENQRLQQKSHVKGKKGVAAGAVQAETLAETDRRKSEVFAKGASTSSAAAFSFDDGDIDGEMVLKNDIKGKKKLLDEPDKSCSMLSDAQRSMKHDQESLDEMLAASIAAEEDGNLVNNASTYGATQFSDEEDGDEEMLLPAMCGNFDPAVLAALPPSMQLDLLVQMRERLMAENRQKYQKVKKVPQKFSELQIQAYLKTVAFRREITEVQKAAAGRGVGGVQTSRIASEANREYIFSSSFTGDKEVLASARVQGDGEELRNTSSKAPFPESVVNVGSVNNSNAAIESNPDDTRTSDEDVESYMDERGRTRVQNKHMGIRMTRDLQRNLALMREKEIMTSHGTVNLESMSNKDKTETLENSSSKHHFNETSQGGKDKCLNSNDGKKQTMFDNEVAIEISFEDDGQNKSLDDNDDIFTQLANGIPVTISSTDNSPQKHVSTSDSDWEEVPIERTSHGSLVQEINISDQSEVEWEEAPNLSLRKSKVHSSELEDTATRGYLEEEADLQEALRRSLLDLGSKGITNAIPGPEELIRSRDSTPKENNEFGVQLIGETVVQQKDLKHESASRVEAVDSLAKINVSETVGSLKRQLDGPSDSRPWSHSEQREQDAVEKREFNREILQTETIASVETRGAGLITMESLDASNDNWGVSIISNRCSIDRCPSFDAMPGNASDDQVKYVREHPEAERPSVDNCKTNIETKTTIMEADKLYGCTPEPAHPSAEKSKASNPVVELSRGKSEGDMVIEADKVYACTPEPVHPSAKKSNASKPMVESSRGNSEGDMVIGEKMASESMCEKHAFEREYKIDESDIKEKENIQVEFTEADLEKEILILDQEYINLGDERRRLERNAESVSSEIFAECQELLQIFGLPYIIAPMEAEAQCAYMEMANLVDGVITDDSDVLLFGSRSVYKNIFDNRKYVETYFMKDIEKELGLSREKLIRMALLLGSDYTEGISGIGIVNAVEVMDAFPEEDGLQKFREWVESPDPNILGKSDAQSSTRKRESVTASDTQHIKEIFMEKHRNVSKNWHLPSSFPSEAIINAYLSPQVDPSPEPFSWGKPDHLILRKLCWEKFGWNSQKTDDLLLPVLKEYEKRETQLRLEAFYSFNERFAKIRSKRIKKAVKGITASKSSEVVDECFEESSRSSKKRRVSQSASGDREADCELMETEGCPENQKNSTKKSTSKQSRKREGSVKAVSSKKGGVDPQLSVGIKRKSSRISDENKRGRGRGRGRGRVQKGVGFDLSISSSTDDSSGENRQEEVDDEHLKHPQKVRRSMRSRKPINYDANNIEDDDSGKSQSHEECHQLEDEQSLFGVESSCADTYDGLGSSKQNDTVNPPLSEGLCGDHLEMGGGFCTDEVKDDQQNPDDVLEFKDTISNDWLVTGGGFCVEGSEMGEDEGAANIPTVQHLDSSEGKAGSLDSHPDPEPRINKDKNEQQEVTVSAQENVKIDLGPFLSGMPFLKRKRRKS